MRLAKSNPFVLLGIGFGLLFWVLETTIHNYIFNHGTFIQELFPSSDVNEIWMRLVIVGIFFVFGFVSQSIISKRERAEAALQKVNDELETRVVERTVRLVETNEQLQREVARRKNVEEALHESEKNLRATIMASPLPIVSVDPEGRVTLWNSAAERVFGWSEQEVLGKPYPIVPTDRHNEHSDLRMRAFEGETFTGIELVRQRKDGALIDVSVSTAPVFDAEGNVKSVMAVLEDVTQRRQAEDALRESEEFYKNLFNNNHAVMLLIDPETADIVDANPAACSYYGYSEKELKGKKITDINMLTPEQVFEEMALAKSDQRRYFHFQHLLATGEIREVEVFSGPINIYGKQLLYSIIHDITERREMEEELSRQATVNAAMAELAAALLEPTSIDDIAHLVLQYANSLTRSEFGFVSYIDPHTGYNIGSTLTRDIWDLCKMDDKDAVFKHFTGLWGWVLNNQKSMITNDPENDSRSTGTPEGHVPISRFLSVPALIGKKLVGQIALANSPVDYTEDDLGLIERLATLYAIGVQRKRVEEALKEAHDQLELRVEERTAEIQKANEQLVREIAERKLAEEALRESEEKFRLVTETIQDVFWMSTPGIGEMIYVSPAYEKIWGRTQESIYKSPKSFLDAIHPGDRERVLTGVQGHAEGVWDFEYRIILPDGSVRWIRDRGFPVRDDQGNLYRMTGVATDITERKLAEERILKSTQMLQSVFDGISDPLIMLDQKLSVKMLNKAAATYYQVTDSQTMVGKPCYEAFKGRASPCDGCIVPARVVNGGTELFERKGLFDSDSLEQVAIYPLREVPGGVTGCILRISDITERKKLDKQLHRADRLSSLGQLSGGIAHEIRNPLSGISLFVDILADEEQFQRTAKELEVLGEIKGNISRINGIIKRILSFAKESDTAASEIDLNSLIQENLKLWYPRMRNAGIKLALSLDEDFPTIFGDAIGIQQVVNNLIQNALETLDGGGSLQISTKNGMSKFYEDRPVVIMSVQDNGPGIDQGLLERIFDPFFTTKSSGIGLGLSISHQIIERHGGIISCTSNPGQGTTFSVELPVVPKG